MKYVDFVRKTTNLLLFLFWYFGLKLLNLNIWNVIKFIRFQKWFYIILRFTEIQYDYLHFHSGLAVNMHQHIRTMHQLVNAQYFWCVFNLWFEIDSSTFVIGFARWNFNQISNSSKCFDAKFCNEPNLETSNASVISLEHSHNAKIANSLDMSQSHHN